MSLDGFENRLRAQEAECAALRLQLQGAEAVLEVIRQGEVDAVMVAGVDGPQVFTLEGADHPYRVMVESMSEGAATLVGAGTVAYANARLAAMLHVPLGQLLGKSLSEFLSAEDAGRLTAACVAARTGPRFEELDFCAADGTAIPARIALNPLQLRPVSQQEIPALVLVATDLTDSRRHAELALAIKERVNAETALRTASRQKDLFLAMLAHELRNPLSPIRSASALLTRLFGADSSAKPLLAMITRQTDQLTRLVDDLLDVSRIAQNRILLRHEPLEIDCIVDQAIETVQGIVEEKSHRLRVERPQVPLHVRGDRARLAQSLANLLHNAAKYTDPGGTLTLVVSATDQRVSFRVHDNGSGISADLLPHVFDLFVQSERTLDRAQGGLGIGLSLAGQGTGGNARWHRDCLERRPATWLYIYH